MEINIYMAGKLIVIDGTDGSGKTTQTELLVKKLREHNLSVETIEFPQYNVKSTGLVEEYLSGKYGAANDVSPRVASMFYAVDRYDASFKMRRWLDEGKIVIANRYVTANMGHQGAKFQNPEERKKFLDWLYELEYEIFKIPKPDLNIILHVPYQISQGLSLQRKREDWAGKTKDIHEENSEHLKAAEQTYLEIANSYPGFVLIECAKDGQIMAREEIAELIWKEVQKTIK